MLQGHEGEISRWMIDGFSVAHDIAQRIMHIMPPREVLNAAHRIGTSENGFHHRRGGLSAQGNPIDVFEFGCGTRTVFWYGFPDPGEAVGATGIVALMEALAEGHPSLNTQDIHWIFIPCLNLDDQPDEAEFWQTIRKRSDQEVDWCVSEPRPETAMLLEISANSRPQFTFPLHDEWHAHEEIPVYFPVSRVMSASVCDRIRAHFAYHDLTLTDDFKHSSMGRGFVLMRELEGDFANSTFAHFAEHGLVAICEVCDNGRISARDLVATQIGFGLVAQAEALAAPAPRVS